MCLCIRLKKAKRARSHLSWSWGCISSLLSIGVSGISGCNLAVKAGVSQTRVQLVVYLHSHLFEYVLDKRLHCPPPPPNIVDNLNRKWTEV